MAPKVGVARLLSSFPRCISARCSTWPLLPTSVPLGRMQATVAALPQEKKFESIEKVKKLVSLLPLKPCQLGWLKRLNASARSSRLTRSARGILKVFFRETSKRPYGDPLPASLLILPLRNWKSTVSPVRGSIAPKLLASAGARKVFWRVAHCAAGAPIAVQAAGAFGPHSALEPSKEAMPAVEMIPFASTFGRCWV